jgi:hypothetical protein
MAYVAGAKINGELMAFNAVTHDPASVSAGAVLDSAMTVTGVRFQDDQSNPIDLCLSASEPAAVVAGIVVVSCRVTADNTVTVRLFNPTAGAVDLASGSWTVIVGRF